MDENYFMDYGDAQEQILLQEAIEYLKSAEILGVELTPKTDPDFFDIPAYLREQASGKTDWRDW